MVFGIRLGGTKSLWVVGCMIWSRYEERMVEVIVESAGLINKLKRVEQRLWRPMEKVRVKICGKRCAVSRG